MFGDEVVCAAGSGDTCEANTNAALWLEDVNLTLRNGHSEGMAVLSQLFALGRLAPGTSAPTHRRGSWGRTRRSSRRSPTGAPPSAPRGPAGDRRFAARDVMPFLAEALKPGQQEAWRLLIAMRGEKASAAATPWSLRLLQG